MPLIRKVGQAVDRLWEKKGSLGIRSSRVKTKATLLGLVEGGYESLRKSGFGPYLREHRDGFGGVIKDIPSDDKAAERKQASSKRQLLRRRIVSAFLELQTMLIGLAMCTFSIMAYYDITEVNKISAKWLMYVFVSAVGLFVATALFLAVGSSCIRVHQYAEGEGGEDDEDEEDA
ncbi:unnamed protein product [Vitrella brassicaformis CCMP3155]|uniref:Uncharacterized protein n=1 Tax=Vitrella brassicaformis (strain CCMP3155) TaxID=1169540 RepID=A0A0G4FSH0_VITBC|nr:unnamed protein product [Vitrella brassicaformis CCMP3155]|eukprot:CEM17604.1 unnamed protein product [Vitrella brassicaformis CCMP3155]